MRQVKTPLAFGALGVCVCFGIVGCGSSTKPLPPSDDSDILSSQRVTITLPVGGGRVKLANIAEVTFPPNTFPEPRVVTLYTDTSRMPETKFLEETTLYDASMPLDYEVRLRVGKTPPAEQIDADIAVDLLIPDSYTPPADFDLQAFAMVEEPVYGNDATMVRMRPVNCEWDPNARRLRIYAPAWMFSARTTTSGAYELVLRVACTPGERIVDGVSTRNDTHTYTCVPRTGCGADPIGSPIGEMGTNKPVDPADLASRIPPTGTTTRVGKGAAEKTVFTTG